MKRLLVLFITLAAGLVLKSQPLNGQPAVPAFFNGTIKGKVVENSASTPVEYATVTLYKATDSTMIDGLVTGASGTFEFKKVEAGTYYITFRFMGFRKVLISDINVSQSSPAKDLGTITLKPESTNLNEVEIVGDKPLVEYQVDRKVVNVDQQINAVGGTAVDVLENIPSVTTDLEGNVALRGSTNFTVLIDGKPSLLTGSDALQQIPASTIDKIEIITNPSAKYNPEGTAGIINIVTKKNSLNGLSGIATVSASTSPDISGDVTLNYRTKKASITIGANASNRQMTGYRNSNRQTYYEDSTAYLQTNSTNKMIRNGYNFKAGIDYSLTEKNTITAEANYRAFDRDRNDNAKNQQWSNLDMSRLNYLTLDSNTARHPMLQFTLQDVHKFNTDGTELSARLTYEGGDDKGKQLTRQSLMDDTWEIPEQTILNYKDNTLESEKEWDGALDFTQNFKDKSKLEAGFQMQLESNLTDYDYYNWDSISNNWIYDTINSNKYDFIDNVYALYGTYEKQWKKLGLKAGLRAEYEDRDLEQKTGGQDYPYQKFDFYPSAYFTYYLPYNQQIQVNYSKRVNRPGGFALNPYPMFSDAFNEFTGNPALEPEYAHSMELNYQKLFGYSYLSIESYYRITTNKISRVQSVNNEGVMVSTMENINNDQSLGVEGSGNVKVNSWFTINPSATVYYYQLNQNTDSTVDITHSTNWNFKIDLSANLKSHTRIRLNGNYDSPSVTADGRREGTYYIGIAARQDFFDSKLSITLNVRDLLDSRHMINISEGSNFYSRSESWRNAPIVSLTVSYKWNNYSRKRSNGESIDGEYDVINGSDY